MPPLQLETVARRISTNRQASYKVTFESNGTPFPELFITLNPGLDLVESHQNSLDII